MSKKTEIISQNIEKATSQKNIKTEVFGKSEEGRSLFSFHIGSASGKQLLVSAGIHAREYASSLFLFDQLFSLAKTGCPYGIFFLPVLNPDGILLSLSGLSSVKCERQKKRLFKLNNKSTDFSLWKANSRGVDLNTNFDADWGKGAKNIFFPASENFVGAFPQSEKESSAIASFVLKTEFAAALSFHTKGEVIFYGQKTKQKKVIQDELHLAKFVSHKNHYDIIQSSHSAGGLSDFIGIKKHIPAITIELGNDLLSHPLTKKNLPEISAKNKGVIEGVCEYLNIS